MTDYRNHKTGHPLYVSPSVRMCGECGNHKPIECFGIQGDVVRTMCRECDREHAAEKEQLAATRAFRKAVTAMSRPSSQVAHGGPAMRQSLKATLDYLHTKCGDEFEADGSQTFGRMFAEWLHRILKAKHGRDGKPISDFLRLKAFTAVQRQMDGLLRHDQQQIDLSKIPDDELGELVAPVMERWFEDNPHRLVQLVQGLPEHLKAKIAEAESGDEPEPALLGIEQGELGDGV